MFPPAKPNVDIQPRKNVGDGPQHGENQGSDFEYDFNWSCDNIFGSAVQKRGEPKYFY